MKRLLDMLVAGLALIALAPLIAAVALLVRLTLGPPVLFRQQRPGLGARPFEMIKFRTMALADDRVGRPQPDEQRLGRVGRFLRASSLDELPELVNVLRGDMSLVGPRPLLIQYLDRYTREQARRHEVRPGITGWAQVNGRNAIGWEEKLAYDVWYVDNRSLLLDLRILLMTVGKLVRPHGIAAEGSATMPEFLGQKHREDR